MESFLQHKVDGGERERERRGKGRERERERSLEGLCHVIGSKPLSYRTPKVGTLMS